MSLIPGVALNITGASGSQGLLSPKQSWNVYIFPRGAYVSQNSTGTLLTFDSSGIASRFAVNNWIQVGLDTANIRKVTAVGGNSISVLGSNVIAATGDRVFLIGNTQPTVVGGSATYTIPNTLVYQRDDTTSTLYTNSMITTNSDGLARFYASLGQYDALIQDGNQSNQGYVADLAVGVNEGVSTSDVSVFGATVTVNATFGITGNFTGDTVTVNKALGVTGWATFGSTVTFNAAIGVTGTGLFGSTVTFNAATGVTGWATFGSSVTITGALGVTGTGKFGSSVTVTGGITMSGDLGSRRLLPRYGTAMVSGDFTLSSTWGATASVSVASGCMDSGGIVSITAGGAGIGSTPTVTINFKDGSWGVAPVAVAIRADLSAPQTAVWTNNARGLTQTIFSFLGTPVSGSAYSMEYIVIAAGN